MTSTPFDVKGRLAALERAFSPSSPITTKDLFLGRYSQLEKTCAAINERGQHFVIYGERGVGKTSLANIISSHIKNVVISKVTCNRDEDFKQLWKKALSKIRFSQEKQGPGFTPEKIISQTQLDLFLPDKAEIDSLDNQTVLEHVNRHLLFVFDEFDSITSPAVRSRFADTIKALSDNATHVTVGLVGIAENIDDLLGHHPSVERCIKQIEMPRMSKDELRQIINKGLGLLSTAAEPEIEEKIVEFSSGFPHYTHLLTKFAAREAITRGETVIGASHYRTALHSAIENTNQSIRDSYQKATIVSKTKSKFDDVIAACALADADEFATFASRDLIIPYKRVSGKIIEPKDVLYNLQKLCESERGNILTKVGESKNIRYRFTNPLMRVYVKMKLDELGSYEAPALFSSSVK